MNAFKRQPYGCLSLSKNLVEFRPKGRNKVQYHFSHGRVPGEKYFSDRKRANFVHKICALQRAFHRETVKNTFLTVSGSRMAAFCLQLKRPNRKIYTRIQYSWNQRR